MAAEPPNLFKFPSDKVIGRPSYSFSIAGTKPLSEEQSLGNIVGYIPILVFLDSLFLATPTHMFPRSNDEPAWANSSTTGETAEDVHYSINDDQATVLGWLEFALEHFFLRGISSTRNDDPASRYSSGKTRHEGSNRNRTTHKDSVGGTNLQKNETTETETATSGNSNQEINTEGTSQDELDVQNDQTSNKNKTGSSTTVEDDSEEEVSQRAPVKRRKRRRRRAAAEQPAMGKRCVQRFICELQSYRLNDEALLAEMVSLLFTIDDEEEEEGVPQDPVLAPYLSAQVTGRRVADQGYDPQEPCSQQYGCPVSLFRFLGL